MVEHDRQVGQLLDKLDELGIADNTIVMYSTDNGAEELSWPDGGVTPFRGEKDTNWEGGWRVPMRDPLAGRHQAGHGLQRDLLAPGHAANAGGRGRRTGHRRQVQEGLQGRRTRPSRSISTDSICCPISKGEVKENPRPGFLYWGDEGDLMAIRYGNWKVHFAVQRAEGIGAWQEPLTELRFPMLVNLRTDPYRERGGLLHVLREVARGSRLHAGASGRARRPVHADHDGVPAAPESGELESWRRDGEAQTPTGASGIW